MQELVSLHADKADAPKSSPKKKRNMASENWIDPAGERAFIMDAQKDGIGVYNPPKFTAREMAQCE